MTDQAAQLSTQQSNPELQERDIVLSVVASLIDTNGNARSKALLRKQALLTALIRKLQKHPDFAPLLLDAEARLIVRASALQDIGKSNVPDKILLKPGKLTPAEYELVKKHPTTGYEALREAERLLGHASTFLRYAQEIAWCHQEKWDGSGYPRQLRGETIPFAARMASIIDVYNAITSQRVYKPALPHEDAIEIMRDLRGRAFDPRITDAFLEISSEIGTLARKYADRFDQQAEIERLASAAAEEITL
ncbi:MAG: HD domain-containing protein [Zoogloeaceae bacterium]|jgi:putative two-component system response regulator|nr:HD domain-containing protein [Zoogloeaceae bacterium]